MSKKQFTPHRAKLTRWFPPEIEPVHAGFYQATIYKNGNPHAPVLYWNGTQWWNPILQGPSATQTRYWRGLARKP